MAHITAPTDVFRRMAAGAGFVETETLFPGPNKDQTLQHLLSLPRMMIELEKPPFPFYMRSLDIPEYHDSFVKHLPTSTVLASRLWLSEIFENAAAHLWIRVEEETFYGNTDHAVPMPRVLEYLRQSEMTCIETDGLICFPRIEGSQSFDKGIAIRTQPDGRFEIGSLSVEYLSNKVSGYGISTGYTYSVENDVFTRSPSENDCPCGDPEKHRLHLQALAILEHALSHGTVSRNGHIVKVVTAR